MGLCQNPVHFACRDIFLYLSAKYMLNINMLLTDKYKNMSLPFAISKLVNRIKRHNHSDIGWMRLEKATST